MLADEYVRQERLGGVEFLFAAAYLFQVLIDYLGTSCLITVQDQADVCQAETRALAGLNNAEPAEVLFAVVSVSRRGSVGHDDLLVLPVAQHVGGYAQVGGGDSDFHSPIMPS